MIINKTFKNIIKIKDLAYINDLGCEIIEFYPNDNTLGGKVYVTGAYHSSKTDEVKLISEDLDFLFELENNDFDVEDIECINFDYSILEGVGIDISYEIKLDIDMQERNEIKEDININQEVQNDSKIFEEFEEDNDEIDTTREINNDSYEDSLEIIKDEINKEIDLKLSSKLEIVNDNLPQDEVVFRSIKEEKSIIKVVYFQDEKQLNEIAQNNNISIDTLFRSNKKTDFNNKKRVIINYGK